MLVRYYTRIRAPQRFVESIIGHLADEMERGADTAYREGEKLRQRLHASEGGFAKDVLMKVGIPRLRQDGTAFPITWRATGATSLFPVMRADVVASSIGGGSTSLVFEGTYEPPLGPLGGAADRLILNRVAEMTVKSWLDELSALIEKRFVESQRDGDLDDGAMLGSTPDGQVSSESVDPGLEIS